MFITFIMAIAYLFIAIFIFKSFVKKKEDFHTSLNMMYGFFLLFIVFFMEFIILVFKIESYVLSVSTVALNITAIYFIVYSSMSIKSVSKEIDGNSLISRRKYLTFIFYIILSITIFAFIYLFANPSNKTGVPEPILFEEKKLITAHMTIVIIQLLIILFHIPSIKEYKWLRIGIVFHIVRLIFNILSAYCDITIFKTITIISGTISMSIFVAAFKSIYKHQKNLHF